jgi:hypothetical protein
MENLLLLCGAALHDVVAGGTTGARAAMANLLHALQCTSFPTPWRGCAQRVFQRTGCHARSMAVHHDVIFFEVYRKHQRAVARRKGAEDES